MARLTRAHQCAGVAGRSYLPTMALCEKAGAPKQICASCGQLGVPPRSLKGEKQQPQTSSNYESCERLAPRHRFSCRMGVCPYEGQPGRSAVAPTCEEEMVSHRKVHVEGKDKATRQQQRRALRPLRNLAVQPATRARYDKALERFRTYLREESRRFPDDPSILDFCLSHYIEILWEAGEGRALACDTIASIQDYKPAVKGRLSSSWRLMET